MGFPRASSFKVTAPDLPPGTISTGNLASHYCLLVEGIAQDSLWIVQQDVGFPAALHNSKVGEAMDHAGSASTQDDVVGVVACYHFERHVGAVAGA
jgi:hypothetical protein